MENNARVPYLEIEGAKLIFRNFSGMETDFNREGNRNFHVLIEDEEFAKQLIDAGWNISVHNKKEDKDPFYSLKVAVRFDVLPPNIFLVRQRDNALIRLDERKVGELDTADIINADIIIRPRIWDINGKTGIKAYLKDLYVTIQENRFAQKYREAAENAEC